MKRSKSETQLPFLDEKGHFHELERQRILDSAAKFARDFGFRQIFPPPFEQKKIYTKNQELNERFGHLLHEINTLQEEEMVLPPTQAYNLLKFYLKNQGEIAATAQKWFYLSAVPRTPVSKGLNIGFELGLFVFGENSSLATAQLINASHQILLKLGVAEALTELNSIGCENCQKQFQEVLESHFGPNANGFCGECAANLSKDALKVLACRRPGCNEALSQAPQMVDFLDEACRENLVGTLEIMDEMETPYALNPSLTLAPFRDQILFRIGVQGKDGFTSLSEGGNCSVLAEHMGAEKIPLLGMTLSIDDLAEHIVPEKISPVDKVDVFVISLGEAAARRAMKIYQELRRSGISTAEAMVGNSGIKRQLKEATAMSPGVALIVGQKEALDDTVILRDMTSGMQEVFTQERILEEVRKRIEG